MNPCSLNPNESSVPILPRSIEAVEDSALRIRFPISSEQTTSSAQHASTINELAVPVGHPSSADAMTTPLPARAAVSAPSSKPMRMGTPIPMAEIGHAIERCALSRKCATRTADVYVEWARRFVMFHACRHPSEMGADEVVAFIRDLAVRKKVAASTQNQALQALVFLYARVLHSPLPNNRMRSVRAKRTHDLPTVLSRTQVASFFQHVVGVPRIVAWLQYGSGLRLIEALRLRVDAINLEQQIVTIPGRRRTIRTVPLPQKVIPPLAALIRERQQQWMMDQRRLPLDEAIVNDRIKSSLPQSPFVFASARTRFHAQSGAIIRHHVDEQDLLLCYRMAFAAAGISISVNALTLRHCFAVHVIERGSDVRTVQEILGQRDIRTTMLYFKVSQRGPACVRSPADDL
jgi:integron integrase